MRSVLIFLLLSLAMTGSLRATGQPAPQQWQEITQDKAFSYKDKKETVEPPKQHSFFATMIAGVITFFASKPGKFIVWSIFFLLAGWALYKIFIGDKTALFSRKKDDDLPDSIHTEEDLLAANWEKQLNIAIAGNDLRMAVRYSYMWLLQLLQERELIQYRNDKTNHDYYHELSTSDYKQPFRQLSRQYEFAWYGDYPLSAEGYESYMNTFNTMKNQLR